MGVPFYVTSCFSLDTFKILSPSLNFDLLMITHFCVDLFKFSFFFLEILGFLNLDICFLLQVRGIFSRYLSK